MKISTVLLLSTLPMSDLPQPTGEPKFIERITAFSVDHEACFSLDLNGSGMNDARLYGSQYHSLNEGRSPNYISLYTDHAYTKITGLYEDLDITIRIGHPGQVPEKYVIEELLLNSKPASSGNMIAYRASPESFRFTIENNDQLMLSGSFWCTLFREGKALPSSGDFTCRKV